MALVSDRYKVIFIHIPRTGGTSFSEGLNRAINAQQFEHKHSPIEKIKRVAPKKYKRYKKVTLVRNPWDRLYSRYKWLNKWLLKGNRPTPTFEKAVKENRIHEHHLRPHQFFIKQGDIVLIDKFCFFETLQTNFNQLCRSVKARPVKLKHLNAAGTRVDYRAQYDNEMIDIVANFYREDIEMFGYTFE